MVPPFGTPGRAGVVSSIFRDTRYRARCGRTRACGAGAPPHRGARTPYEATIRIERWLRTDGGFVYDERPPAPRAACRRSSISSSATKLGYCQQFAGTMALMLRYLGIPARVAVGFTSGTWKDGTWTVTDHDAHAWVEAWFAGYGWLTFDPTPGRGTLSAHLHECLRLGRRDPRARHGPLPRRAARTRRWDEAAHAARRRPSSARAGRTSWPYAVPVAVLLAALLGLAALKHERRRRRAATRDPRALASAARADLVDFLRDQGSQLSPTAPLGELVAELRRLGVAGDGFASAFSRARFGRPETAEAAAAETRLERRAHRVAPARPGRGGEACARLPRRCARCVSN